MTNLGRNLLSKIMKQDPVPKIFDHLDMNAAIKGILVLGAILLFISGCSQPVQDPQISLYKRLGGEKTLVAVSLQVSRKPAMRKLIAPDQARIFRQRLSEWLCKASSGPCDFPGRKEFFQEIELNPEQQQQLLQALEEVLRETGIPETNQQELLSKLLKS